MGDFDFAALRAAIEAATKVPDFEDVARRARRTRRRGWLVIAISALALTALAVPVSVIAVHEPNAMAPVSGSSAPAVVGPDTPTTPPDATPQPSLITAAGADLNHVYALVDVCLVGSCDLQLSPVLAAASQVDPQVEPVKVGLLRNRPTDWLGEYQLEAITDTSLLVSAVPSNGSRRYDSVVLTPVADNPGSNTARVGDRAVQTSQYGEIQAVDAKTGQLRSMPTQPPVDKPAVVGSVAPTRGVWVTGTDPESGRVAISVTRDAGRSWTTVNLGIRPGTDAPVLASYNGQTAYLLIRAGDGHFALARTLDGGATWRPVPTSMPWPSQADPAAEYGLVVRPDGSLLAWLATTPATTYLDSTNGGGTFAGTAGPGGPVFAVSDGYVALGSPPKLSPDGVNWATADVPFSPTTGG